MADAAKSDKKHHHKTHHDKKDKAPAAAGAAGDESAARREARAKRREERHKDPAAKSGHKSSGTHKSSHKDSGKDKKPKTTAATSSSSAAAAAADPGTLAPGVLTKPIAEDFDLGDVLGSGAFSVVRRGVSKKDGQKVAIKIIKKTTVAGDDIKLLRREVQNLKKLDHPNIMKLYEVYENNDEFYLVLELIEGKELFDKIVDRGNYSERDASNITRQFVAAIEYLHSRGIAHRDLKPENLMSIGSGATEVVKLADFGLSKNFGDEKLMTSCGSPGYVAPEVLECETYDKLVDMWSVGVILYILLVGYPPFYADSDPELFKKIMACDYEFGEGWDVVSDSAKDLIRNLLVKDPKKRFTATQALNHPWLKSADLSQKQLQMTKLRDYVSKKAITNK
jgi:calcium/calmodulin-dependent protein kinase I